MLYDDSTAESPFIGHTDQLSHWAFKHKASDPPQVGKSSKYYLKVAYSNVTISHRVSNRTVLVKNVDFLASTTQTAIAKGIALVEISGSMLVALRR